MLEAPEPYKPAPQPARTDEPRGGPAEAGPSSAKGAEAGPSPAKAPEAQAANFNMDSYVSDILGKYLKK
jgi:hypothetical protein